MVAALAIAPTAGAKGPDTARVCGSSGCATVTNVEKVNALALMASGFELRSEPKAAPFLTVELTSSRRDDIKWSFLYVPSAAAIKILQADFSGLGSVEGRNQWVSPGRPEIAAYTRAAAGLVPFAASPEWTIPTRSNDGFARAALAGAVLVGALLVALLLAWPRLRPRERARLGVVGRINRA
jgi:hypothetical protein